MQKILFLSSSTFFLSSSIFQISIAHYSLVSCPNHVISKPLGSYGCRLHTMTFNYKFRCLFVNPPLMSWNFLKFVISSTIKFCVVLLHGLCRWFQDESNAARITWFGWETRENEAFKVSSMEGYAKMWNHMTYWLNHMIYY